jgi:hypothetical protein
MGSNDLEVSVDLKRLVLNSSSKGPVARRATAHRTRRSIASTS